LGLFGFINIGFKNQSVITGFRWHELVSERVFLPFLFRKQ